MRSFLIASLFLVTAAAAPAMAAQPMPRPDGGSARDGGWRDGARADWGRERRDDRRWDDRRWNEGHRDDAHWADRRWGGQIDGRWHGGVRAPGGWRAYRRPQRGWAMPGYWMSPDWAIGDWRDYDLPPPPPGYGWSRYYDDAVLLDRRGRVFDTIVGLDWARGHGGYGYGRPYYAPGVTATTTVELPPPVTTTTTTTTVTEEWVYPKSAATRAGARVVRERRAQPKTKLVRRTKLIRR